MRINRIILRNFAAIMAGMKKREITININSKNRIVLLVGGNGTGKTALMMNLHVFAYPGTMDTRNSDGLILENEDGYKEVELSHLDNVYIVKHFYKWSKDGHTVKSFFSKDGVELNPNGNVTSFKELISLELGLELDYLKLLRLGSNVTNFIDLKSTERKNFTSELLSDIDVYSKFYKKINDDSRVMRSLLKNVVDKLDKLRIIDVVQVEDTIQKYTTQLDILKERKDHTERAHWQLQGTCEALFPEGIDHINNRLFELEDKSSTMNKNMKELSDKIGEYHDTDISSYIKELDNEISSLHLTISEKVNTSEMYVTNLKSLYEQLDSRKSLMSTVSSIEDLDNMRVLLDGLCLKHNIYNNKFKDFNPTYTKSDMLISLSLMQKISSMVDNINTYPHWSIRKCLRMIIENEDIKSFVEREVSKIDLELQIMKVRHMMSEPTYVDNRITDIMMFTPSGCPGAGVCSYYTHYIKNLKEPSATSIVKDRSSTVVYEQQKESLMSIIYINSIVDTIQATISAHKNLIDKLPEDFFNIKKIFDAIYMSVPLYQESEFSKYINLIEEYEEYTTLETSIKELKKEIYYMENNKKTLDTLNNEVKIIEVNIANVDMTISLLQKTAESKKKQLERTLEEKKIVENVKLINEMLEADRTSLRLIENEISSLKAMQPKINEILKSKEIYSSEIQKLTHDIEKVEDEIVKSKFTLMEFENLTKERLMLEERYDEIETIRESLSTNKGMPLLFIKLYMEDVKLRTNELLGVVYNGELEIVDFDINDKEFNIPYIKNGLGVSDIRMSSQGEKSFINLAISFALSRQSITKYNILLLDEIDATLDATNRYVFISILERQLDIIRSEQCFLITHNNMFDNYPVSLIMTSPVDIDNFKNVELIKIK